MKCITRTFGLTALVAAAAGIAFSGGAEAQQRRASSCTLTPGPNTTLRVVNPVFNGPAPEAGSTGTFEVFGGRNGTASYDGQTLTATWPDQVGQTSLIVVGNARFGNTWNEVAAMPICSVIGSAEVVQIVNGDSVTNLSAATQRAVESQRGLLDPKTFGVGAYTPDTPIGSGNPQSRFSIQLSGLTLSWQAPTGDESQAVYREFVSPTVLGNVDASLGRDGAIREGQYVGEQYYVLTYNTQGAGQWHKATGTSFTLPGDAVFYQIIRIPEQTAENRIARDFFRVGQADWNGGIVEAGVASNHRYQAYLDLIGAAEDRSSLYLFEVPGY